MTLTVAEISRRLSERAEELCRFLLPGGKRERGNWITGDVSGSRGKSLHVHLEGQYAGHWKDFAADEDKGDLLDLWRFSKGITAIEAIREAKQWLGIQDPAAARSERDYAKPPKDVTKILGSNGTAIDWLVSKRGLDVSIVNKFRVEGSAEHKAIAFPCYSPAGNLVNRSYRTLGADKKVWQDKGCAPSLFGWQALDESAYKTSTILLCEGQIDCMTWTQLGFNALSVPNGSGLTWIEFEWDNLSAFDRVYLSFDQDGTGNEMVERVINRLGRHRCMVVLLPKKDINDCLLAGYSATDAEQWVLAARVPRIQDLVMASELEQRILRECEPKAPVFTLPFLKGSDDEGRTGFYPRPGEVTIWSGTTHNGKSTFLNYFILSLLVIGQNVMVASMEMKVEALIRRMLMSYHSRKPTVQDVSAFIQECGSNLIFADKVGFVAQDELMDMMRYSYQRYGVTHLFIDSLMRVDKLEEDYVAQGAFLNILQEFAKSTGAHVHLVAHPRKKDESRHLDKLDIKGSSLIPNNADNIVFVIRNFEKERLRADGKLSDLEAYEMHDTEIMVDKQRETGWCGSFYLRFDPQYFAYSAIKHEQANT